MSSPSTPLSAAVSPALAALRQALDQVDDQLLDLLMRRADIVGDIRQLGDKGPVKLRPGREAAILRRLIARNVGGLPAETVVRVWRELFASSLSMQGNFSLAVGGEALLPTAREHFGALTTMRVFSAAAVLRNMAAGESLIGVVPWLGSDAANWFSAKPFVDGKLHIVARLPFWSDRRVGADVADALVISTLPPDPSGDDRSLILPHAGFEPDRWQSTGIPDPQWLKIGDQRIADVAGFIESVPPEIGQKIGGYATPLGTVPPFAAALSPTAL